MHELTGRLMPDVSFSARGNVRVTVEFSDKACALEMFNDLSDEEKITLKVDKYRKKRSLDANAYCWVLISKLADKLHLPKETVYRTLIRSIGGTSDIICTRSETVDSLRECWHRNGIGWQTETMPSKIEGCTNVVLYYGSSTYNTEQMRRLIDSVVYECKQFGIETRTPDEIANLLSMWEARKER